MSEGTPPPYFELSWAILSTIGLANILSGIVVLGITGTNRIVFVPIVVSAAGALANGLCYYAFYSNYPVTAKVVAAVFADLGWLIQEAGLSFYSYLVLIPLLSDKSRRFFKATYWALILIITACRLAILAYRVRYLLTSSLDLFFVIGRLHVGYFTGLAIVELLSALLLLRHFSSAFHLTTGGGLRGGLFKHLMRSTEIRVSLLCLIGITRAITYSFQATAQSATTVAGQIDRFVYTLETMFPVIMYIDILASRLTFADDMQQNSSTLL